MHPVSGSPPAKAKGCVLGGVVAPCFAFIASLGDLDGDRRGEVVREIAVRLDRSVTLVQEVLPEGLACLRESTHSISSALLAAPVVRGSFASRSLSVMLQYRGADMKEAYKRLGEQLGQIAEEGRFGTSVRISREEYEKIPTDTGVFLKCVSEADNRRSGINEEVIGLRRLFMRFVVSVYRLGKKANEDVAEALLLSLIEDYPGVPESCLCPQFCAFAEACLAFREVATSSDRLLIWQQLTRSVLACNEFLNALFGYLIPCLRAAVGKDPAAGVFRRSYRSRIDELVSLSGGSTSEFAQVIELARPRIRNAIAHNSIWLDGNAAKVRYTEGGKLRQEYEMKLSEFGKLALLGSHLCEPYLAAIGAIAILENGSEVAKRQLPEHLVAAYRA